MIFIMKKYCITIFLFSMLVFAPIEAQNTALFKEVVTELSSSKYQGRGYTNDGVRKAGKYIERQFQKVGVDKVETQSYNIDINTFPGKMEMSVDGRKLQPGDDFVMREYSPGVKGSFGLYYIDTANYNFDQILSDLQKPENKGCFVVCDFWFTYKHGKDFRKLESLAGAPNAGVVYQWDSPLKFYKAYGEKVVEKPIIWVSSQFPTDAKQIKTNIGHRFLPGYASDNVIAVVEGRRHDSCYVFTAHYDHLGKLGRKQFYPGANDNASGTAAIITLAEYYVQHRPEFDMLFIAFSGEETGLRGSTYYVEHPMVELSKIIYLFNLDMVGDNNPVQYVEVSDAGNAGFARMEQMNASNHYFQSFNRGQLAGNSDHYPFAQKGVPCILFENEEGDAFPFYHTYHDDMAHFRFDTYGPLFRLLTDFVNQK